MSGKTFPTLEAGRQLFFLFLLEETTNRTAKVQVMHERSHTSMPICTCIIRKKNIEVSAIADAAGPEKQSIHLAGPNSYKLHYATLTPLTDRFIWLVYFYSTIQY